MWERWVTRPTDEVEAARIGMSGNWRARVLYGLHTGLVFAINPSDTLQVNLMTVGIDYRGLRALGARFAADPRWHRLVTERATIDTKHVDFEYLRKLGPETLGGAYVRMLDRNGLDPDFFQPPPEWPEDQAYVLQRLRQTHDMMHVLTGLDTDIPGEIALQAFVRVQLRLLFSLFVVVFGGMIYAPRYPRMVPLIVRAYIAGHRADLLFSTRWEDLWEVPLEEVRRRFHITNLECPRPSDVSESATRPADATAALRIPAAQAACWAAE